MAVERTRGIYLNVSPHAHGYWDCPCRAATFPWNAGVDVWAERVMQAMAVPPSYNDVVDPAYAAALAVELPTP